MGFLGQPVVSIISVLNIALGGAYAERGEGRGRRLEWTHFYIFRGKGGGGREGDRLGTV